MKTGDVIERQIRIEARPETVFQFFIDPERMMRWMGSSVMLDPRPDGIYRVQINEQNTASGRYVEVDPPHRVVFTFGWEGQVSPFPPGSSTVEVILQADGDGTIVRLRHYDLPVDQRERHAQAWEYYLGRLDQAALGRDPGPDLVASSPDMAG